MKHLFGICVLVGILLAMATPVRAQTPEPTTTPTPAYQVAYTLSSGDTLVVERRITYGEIAIVIGLGLVVIVMIIYALIRIPRLWLR